MAAVTARTGRTRTVRARNPKESVYERGSFWKMFFPGSLEDGGVEAMLLTGGRFAFSIDTFSIEKKMNTVNSFVSF